VRLVILLQRGGADVFVGAPISQACEELVGQFDLVQQSVHFIRVGLEQGPISCIYGPSAPDASRNQSDLFVAKCVPFDFSLVNPESLAVDLHGTLNGRSLRAIGRRIYLCLEGSEMRS